jgi:Tfp pilus assembly protein FimT
MKARNKYHPRRGARQRTERGISIVEMIVVVAMIGVVTAFAVMQIATAQRRMRVTNSARELVGWLEKARVDSIRRHAMPGGGEMASVKIATSNSYAITIDQDGDGTLDPPRTITTPAANGATFADITIPTTIYYNWRGRTVDSSGNLLNLSFNLHDASGNITPINLASAGDTSLGSNVNATAVSISGGDSTANIKAKTYGP